MRNSVTLDARIYIVNIQTVSITVTVVFREVYYVFSYITAPDSVTAFLSEREKLYARLFCRWVPFSYQFIFLEPEFCISIPLGSTNETGMNTVECCATRS